MAKSLPNLGPAEWEILRILWEEEEASAKQVAEILRRRRPVAQTTVTTLLTRLRDKGVVHCRKASKGKAFVYSPALKPDDVRPPLFLRLAKQLFGDDLVSAFAALVEEQDLSPAELRQLRAVVNKAAKDADKKTSEGASS